ncbi:rhomboid family intramembrane serine protease [Cyanobacterium sp. uoEpiScrs1]|uniref:rhomboid family intramembrane serine protease n=1 Tax=Cyanobacterium sp. uoEpiScrs1 TaxID=2976343 RepID=UPI00226A5498|nr:rhomboid family intramembrane serine protease [Cyanobacterium sp. uoEpiScrs1]
MNYRKYNSIFRKIKSHVNILMGFISIFWVSEFLDVLIFKGSLDKFGIIPHNLIGLRGILFAPFLHAGLNHLIANTIHFIVLGWLVMLQKISDFWIVTLLTMIVGGIGVWLFGGPGSVHIGASIIIFGYLGFLLLRGYFQHNFVSIFLSIVVCFFYSGLVLGILPSRSGISWEGHLCGFLSGVFAAKLIASEK